MNIKFVSNLKTNNCKNSYVLDLCLSKNQTNTKEIINSDNLINNKLEPLDNSIKNINQVEPIGPVEQIQSIEQIESIEQIDLEPISKIDIEKIKLEMKIEDLQNKLSKNKSEELKNTLAEQLAQLAIDKGIIDIDDKDIEILKILSFSEDDFNNYKKEIMEYEINGEVISKDKPAIKEIKTEAELALEKFRYGGSNTSTYNDNSSNMDLSNNCEKRTLIADKKFGIDNYKIKDTSDAICDNLENILFTKTAINNENIIDNNENIIDNSENNSFDFSGFKNLQGITKPIQITASQQSTPFNGGYRDFFDSLDWTVLGGK